MKTKRTSKSSINKFLNSQSLWKGGIYAALGAAYAFSNILPNYLVVVFTLGSVIIYLVIAVVSYKRPNQTIITTDDYDHPRPPRFYILQRIGITIAYQGLLGLATLPFMFVLSAAEIWSPISWLTGLVVSGLWLFAYDMLCAFTTKYHILKESLEIEQGLWKISLPFVEIGTIEVVHTPKISLEKIFITRSLIFLGVRYDNLVVIERVSENHILDKLYTEIYISPKDPFLYKDVILGRLRQLNGHDENHYEK